MFDPWEDILGSTEPPIAILHPRDPIENFHILLTINPRDSDNIQYGVPTESEDVRQPLEFLAVPTHLTAFMISIVDWRFPYQNQIRLHGDL